MLTMQAGARFGRLVVIGEGEPRLTSRGDKQRRVRVVCDCGNKRNVAPNALASGGQVSCGCYNSDRMRSTPPSLKHGNSAKNIRTPEYGAWCNMISRCTNKKLPCWTDYGGRGIRVCSEWRSSFKAFLSSVGPRPSPQHSIDRKNNDGNYEPGNVRWATRQQQNANRTYRKNETVTQNATVTLFCFINGQPPGDEGYIGMVLSDRGEFLLEHIVETPDDAPGYLGIGTDCHHDMYAEYAPNGFTLVWVAAPLEHADVQAAYKLHMEMGDVTVELKTKLVEDANAALTVH